MNILDYSNYYLVGIKGVAMTSLAQCLLDAGKSVTGSDVNEEFVTQKILDDRGINSGFDFRSSLPEKIDCLVYTSAHLADQNPQVKQALERKIPSFSQAEAIASLFNSKKGIAVSGVGGKSTVSAMITWILEETGHQPSFSVGVGNIPGLNKTGRWRAESDYFVIEADEYVTDPAAPDKGEKIKARFSYLYPKVIVCTNLKFDHPDVYRDFEHTKQVYGDFFAQLPDDGTLILNYQDQQIVDNLAQLKNASFKMLSFGESNRSGLQLTDYKSSAGKTTSSFTFQSGSYSLSLKVPGKYNVMNGLAAILACSVVGVDITESAQALQSFRSTMRRFEFVGEKRGVKYYDDYAHHPHEVSGVIEALREWYPEQKKVIAFQSHTYSRTKALFAEFVDSFAKADEVVMIDIFSSAREKADQTVTSTKLCEAIVKKYPKTKARNLKTVEMLANFCQTELKSGDVLMTVGAGDIYQVHQLLD